MWTDDGQLELLPGTDRPAARRVAPAAVPAAQLPSTDTERALAAILAELLGAAEVGRYDDFFNLGGDSILAVQAAAKARDGGLALTPRMVFEHPVLHELAAALDATAPTESGPRDTSYAPMSTSGLSADELSALAASWDRS